MNWQQFIAWATSQGVNLLSVVLKTVILAAIGYLAIRIVMRILTRILEKSKLEKAAHSLIKTLVKSVLYLLFGLILASSLGIDVTGIVALASIVTLALSLALQNMLTNVIGGFTLLYTHPFHSGDFVEIAGQSGTVQEVGIAYTKLTTPDNKLVSIPNSAVVAAQIVNYSILGIRRVDIPVQVSRNSDPEQVVTALLDVAKDPRVLQDPAPFAALDKYEDSAATFVLRIWTKSELYWDIYFYAMDQVNRKFREQAIEMTYPHLSVHLEK